MCLISITRLHPEIMLKHVLCLLLLLTLQGCVTSEYRDISRSTENAAIVGKSYLTREPLIIHGVIPYKAKTKSIGTYVLTPRPGFGGREVLSKEVLPIGTKLSVVGIKKCINCISGTTKVIIKIEGAKRFGGLPVEMNSSFGGRDILVRGAGTARLNRSLFEETIN